MSQSVYQANGKPLSQTAIYQQRLRQGVYQSPSNVSVGVNTNASDTAALLAASSDLTVKPSYERTIAQDAHTAALLAKRDEASILTRDNEARTATMKSVGSGYTGVTGAVNGGSIYKVATKNSSGTMTSRLDPVKDYRHGLGSKSSATTLNIGKINQIATQKSTKSLNSRFNPDLDYRSGLAGHHRPAEFLDQEEEDLAASGATASLKHGGSTSNSASSQVRSKSFKSTDVAYGNLLAAANDKAQDRLKSLNSSTGKDFKQQAREYAGALAIAQKNSDERMKNNKAGMVDLGGGLTMSLTDLDAKAALVVGPVLSDIESKATAQREADEQSKAKHAKLVGLHQKSKQEDQARKERERKEIEKEKGTRVTANEDRKKGEENEYIEYQASRNEEVENKVGELKALELKYAEEKEKLLGEKQENQDRIDAEEKELNDSRSKELKELQAEKDEILKPTLDELEEENTKLEAIVNSKNEIAEEVEKLKALNEEYDAKLAELTNNLEKVKIEIEEYTMELELSTQKHEETSKEVDNLRQTSIDELKQAEDSHKELDSKISELDATKSKHLEDKVSQRKEIESHLDQRVKSEHEINKELPEHLQKDIDEDKLRDTGSLFDEPKFEDDEEDEAETPQPAKSKSVGVSGVKEIPLVDDKELETGAVVPSKSKSEAKSKDTEKKSKSAAGTTAKESKKTESKTSNTKSPAKAKPASNQAANESPKKLSGFKRFTKYFSGHEEQPASAKKAEPKSTKIDDKTKPATSAAKSATKDSKSSPAKDTSKSASNTSAKDASEDKPKVADKVDDKLTKKESEGSAEDIDDLSSSKNQGGVFKEEI
ncbi:uncharacterized protein AC631_04577 [Debaryomyces fabryi]|uniref:Eisosome protein 1 n=1 Tax=Debaryomyces fabryi TaxID=58627 RepID=A0A0V1PTT4_9ASCO|nr:uncharacterized protein AC631_04577 [Debaryomyces fabryi]KRZ99670.1 hypothetical protein AC631_04577 [Debaryomyces fabryi]CUM51199.1 unnamed protein product [Debaryomyces fabryi]